MVKELEMWCSPSKPLKVKKSDLTLYIGFVDYYDSNGTLIEENVPIIRVQDAVKKYVDIVLDPKDLERIASKVQEMINECHDKPVSFKETVQKHKDSSNTLVRLRNLSGELDTVYVETVRYEELVEETAKRVRDKSIAMYALLMLVKEMFNKVELSLTEVRSSLSNIVWDMEGEGKEKEGEGKNG